MKNFLFSSPFRSLLLSSCLLGMVGLTGCNSSQTQWEGKWELKDPTTEQSIEVILSEDGKLYLLPPEGVQEEPTAYEIPLTRVSDETTVPEGYTITSLEEEMEKQAELARLAEAKQYVTAMTRAQQAYHLEKSEFATTFEEMGLPIESETDNFTYTIVPQDDPSASVLMTASAKTAELRSYSGVVYVVGEQTKALVCETDDNAMTPPETPTLDGEEIQCAEGSSPLQ